MFLARAFSPFAHPCVLEILVLSRKKVTANDGSPRRSWSTSQGAALFLVHVCRPPLLGRRQLSTAGGGGRGGGGWVGPSAQRGGSRSRPVAASPPAPVAASRAGRPPSHQRTQREGGREEGPPPRPAAARRRVDRPLGKGGGGNGRRSRSPPTPAVQPSPLRHFPLPAPSSTTCPAPAAVVGARRQPPRLVGRCGTTAGTTGRRLGGRRPRGAERPHCPGFCTPPPTGPSRGRTLPICGEKIASDRRRRPVTSPCVGRLGPTRLNPPRPPPPPCHPRY